MHIFLEIAEKEARKAQKRNDIPVGAVIVKNNQILSKAHNKKYKKNNPIYHAEIIAIMKACKKMKTNRLDDCDIYVTLEPCEMCYGAIKETRIKNVFYGCKSMYNLKEPTKTCLNSPDSLKIIQHFFKKKRTNVRKLFPGK